MDLHGPPDLVIENEELLENIKNWHFGLFSVLQSNFPNEVDVITNSDTGDLSVKVIGTDITYYIIDGIPVKLRDYAYLQSLPTEEIKSFEIIKKPEDANRYEFQITGDIGMTAGKKVSFISIYTYSGKGFYGVFRAKGIYKGLVPGFAPKLEFYAPKYDNEEDNDWNVPDLRSVLHWAPNVKTDENGEAEVEFYNADNIGDMLVIVEGITKNGKIGYVETQFTVDKKIEK